MKLFLLLFFLIKFQELYGSVIIEPFKKPTLLNYGVVIEPHLRRSATEILGPALSLVSATLSEQLILQHQRQEGGQLDFIIQVTDRKTIAGNDHEDELVQRFTKSIVGDAYSFIISNHPGSPVIVRVLWDEAMYKDINGKKVERSDAFARLVTLLGHEILGNVKNFISRRQFYESPSFLYSDKVRSEEFLNSEVRAFTGGVEFLNTLISRFKDMLSAKLVQNFQDALEREKTLLTRYQSRVKPMSPKTNIPNVIEVSFKTKNKCLNKYIQ